MKRLTAHHEEAYPKPTPTPGDVCRDEAARLNEMGLGDAREFQLLETQVDRVGSEVRVTHVLLYLPRQLKLCTLPFTNYE